MNKGKISKLLVSLGLGLLVLNLMIRPISAKNNSLQGERIYQIMTDRFYDGDKTNNAKGEALRYQENSEDDMRYMKGGDWQGIIEKNTLHKRNGIYCNLDFAYHGRSVMERSG